jgi:hypothetical protein
MAEDVINFDSEGYEKASLELENTFNRMKEIERLLSGNLHGVHGPQRPFDEVVENFAKTWNVQAPQIESLHGLMAELVKQYSDGTVNGVKIQEAAAEVAEATAATYAGSQPEGGGAKH